MAAARTKSDEEVGAGDPGPAAPRVYVTVVPPYQCVDHGVVFGPGDTAQVPEDVAAHWIACGWAVPQ